MKKSLLFVWMCCIIMSCCSTASKETKEKAIPVNLVLDTDLGPDYDDVGAMALMHALADSGQVNILATISCNQHEMVIPCMDVLNTYFGRPDLPVGAPKGKNAPNLTTWHKEKWTESLPANYSHRVKKTSEAPDAVNVYRKILSEADNGSVTICTIGFFTNLKGLLESGADEYSSLSGKELVAKKVKRLVSMACDFPQGREFNVFCDVAASEKVLTEWPTEIIFSGFEIGKEILTGTSVIKMNVENSPVVDTYRLCLAEGDFDGRMSWDQTAVLVSIKGYEPYYTIEKGTVKIVDELGNNEWAPDENGKHIRLIEKMPVPEVTGIIENYMKHQPLKN